MNIIKGCILFLSVILLNSGYAIDSSQIAMREGGARVGSDHYQSERGMDANRYNHPGEANRYDHPGEVNRYDHPGEVNRYNGELRGPVVVPEQPVIIAPQTPVVQPD